MKKILCLIAGCLWLHVEIYAQPEDEQQVALAVEKLKQAMIAANKPQLQALTANELSYGHSAGKIEDQAARWSAANPISPRLI